MSQRLEPWEYRGYAIFPNGTGNKWSVVKVDTQEEVDRQPTKFLVRKSIDKRCGG